MSEITVIESNFNAAAETDSGYGQLFAVLLRRRFWLLGVMCGALSAAFFITRNTEPTYESSMRLLVEPNYPEKETIGEQQATQSSEADYATQLNLMRSSQFFKKALDLLHPEYPTLEVGDIKGNLALTQIKEGKADTKIFQAVYSSNDPIKTQKVLKALQKVYQDYNLEQEKLRLTRGLSFIEEQLQTAREGVIEAEGSLEQFRKRQNLIDPAEQAKAVAENLNKVEQERRAIGAQYQETQAIYTALKEQLARSPQEALISSRLSQSSRYQTLLSELQKTELALGQERTVFTDADPRVVKLLEQRESQRQLLQEEVGKVLGEASVQVDITGERLFSEGQLGKADIELATKLVEAEATLQSLKARDESLAKTEQQLRVEINRFPSMIAQYNRLQPEVEIKRKTLEQLLVNQQDLGLELARGGFNWQVVEEARLGEKIGPNLKRNLMLGAVVGLFLGGIAAFVRESLDDAVHTSDDLKKGVALPLLGIIPELPQADVTALSVNLPFRKLQVSTPSILQAIHWLPFRESLDLIYKNIQFLSPTRVLKSLMVTSAVPGEGKSTLVLGLALSAARLHQRVLLIDADLRRPTLHKQLNLPNEQGLSTLLTSDSTVPSPLRVSLSDSNIDILTAGPTPADPVKLLSSRRMQELMAIFEQSYDLVLLDTPPVLGTVDALQVASFCSGVVMVGRIERITQSELTEATAMLSKLNAIGIVANGASASMKGYLAPPERNGNSPSRVYQPLVGGQGLNDN